MTLKPLPCPFCGSDNVVTEVDYHQGSKWGFAGCECGARAADVRTGYDMSPNADWRDDAIEEWNTRAPEKQQCPDT